MFLQAFLPLLRKAAQLGTGMGCHRAAIINMSSLAASMQLVQANEMFLKVYPYRIAKVCGLPRAVLAGWGQNRGLETNVS